MSHPSDWPLPQDSIRFVLPRRMVSQLANHPLSRQLYPLGIGYYQYAKGHQMSRQQHDDNLLIYCLEGQGRLEACGKKRIIQPGELMLLAKGTEHTYHADPYRPWTIYWIHFDGELSQDFIDQINPDVQNPVVPLGLHSRLVADFEALLDTRQASHHLNAFLHSANLLRQIMTHIVLLKPLGKRQANDTFDLEKIHSLMQARLHEQLDVDTLANAISMSKFHFIKKYGELTGTTPINHFIQLKIERACHLLDVTSKSIAEVGWAIGYEDAYYFSRIFKKIMGISPSHYRRIRLGASSYKS
ncbi:AraC family transcriptional regulator [Nitrincola alkalilacustris]|uniref:AraC family transcriptional regulator n=1 Tax=Nitrincola alkalilacustris TaxID=1571224 RepID=UPI00124C3D43|nr:AraC family ligand binding domain-containing protein [Nitrincola alkalilacustris]